MGDRLVTLPECSLIFQVPHSAAPSALKNLGIYPSEKFWLWRHRTSTRTLSGVGEGGWKESGVTPSGGGLCYIFLAENRALHFCNLGFSRQEIGQDIAWPLLSRSKTCLLFEAVLFAWSRFWSLSTNNLVPPFPARSNFWQVDSCVKTYATSKNLFGDKLEDNWSLFFILVKF